MCCTRSSKFDLMHLQLHSLNKRSSNFGVRKHFSPCVSFLLLLLLLCSIRFVSFLHMCILFFSLLSISRQWTWIYVYTISSISVLTIDRNLLKRHAVQCCLARICIIFYAVFVCVWNHWYQFQSRKWNGCLVINYLLYDFENRNWDRKGISYSDWIDQSARATMLFILSENGSLKNTASCLYT